MVIGKNKFNEWLKNNTNLLERTIKLYVRTINRFLISYGEPTIENMNKFITESFREKCSFYVRYAFKHYLAYLGKVNEYKELVKVKQKPAKKEGVYLPREQVEAIANNIGDVRYRTVAVVQYLTGARAHDVLGFKKDNIIQMKDGTLKLILLPKGEQKQLTVIIPVQYSKIIFDFIITSNKLYPFLKGESYSFEQLVDNNYHHYEIELKKSANDLGFSKFSSHDFRRNFITDGYEKTKNVFLMKEAVGHARIETTLRYLKRIQEEDKKKMVESIRG